MYISLQLVETMLRLFMIVSLVHYSLAEETCSSYEDYMRPLLVSGDIGKLQEAFLTINDPNNAVVRKFMFPIERTVAVEKHNIRMLVSLSMPLISTMNMTEMWPVNNNISETKAAEGATDFLTEFTPESTVHGGIRYVYGCQRLQEKSCFKEVCKYNPEKPVMRGEGGKEVYVPLDNFLASNGSDMSMHIKEGLAVDVYDIIGFKKMAIEECFARQLFVKLSEDDCFNSSKFFSLSERTESYHWGAGRIGVAEKTAFFVVMS